MYTVILSIIPGSIDGIIQALIGSDLDKDEKGAILSVSDFSCQSGSCQCLDETLKVIASFDLVCS